MGWVGEEEKESMRERERGQEEEEERGVREGERE